MCEEVEEEGEDEGEEEEMRMEMKASMSKAAKRQTSLYAWRWSEATTAERTKML